MGFDPRMQLCVRAGDAVHPLAALDALLAETSAPWHAPRPCSVPFAGGVVIALAYEAKNAIEPRPARRALPPDAPYLTAALYDAVVAYDHRRREYHAATWHLDDAALGRYAEEILDLASEARARVASVHSHGATAPPAITTSLDARAYAARVERALEYIAAGDVYQINLSVGFHVPLDDDPLRLYSRLRTVQPVPFGGWFDCGDDVVLSNSPELFLRRRGTTVTTCPIKGTRPRADDEAEDIALAEELAADPKEQAEHVMIVDLERNDLGRVCTPGSVRVAQLSRVASFRTVHHMVSTVSGTLRGPISAGDLLAATFPSGSITGAPKIRATEIIDELEPGPRGWYTGALGWIDASGDCDLNVAIRTAVARGGALTYHAGSGIVADSRPEAERAECLLKASAFFAALQGAAKPLAALANRPALAS
jgi:para-aminobenzoate synthetase component I